MALEETLYIERGEYEIHSSLDIGLVDALSFLVSDGTEQKKALIKNYESYVNPKYFVLVKKHGELAGAAVVEKVTDTIDYVDKFFVAKKFQSNGIGPNMMKVLKQYSPALGLRADETNDIAINFYQKHNFKQIGQSQNFGIYGFEIEKKEKNLMRDYASRKSQTIFPSYQLDENYKLLQKFLEDIDFSNPKPFYALQN